MHAKFIKKTIAINERKVTCCRSLLYLIALERRDSFNQCLSVITSEHIVDGNIHTTTSVDDLKCRSRSGIRLISIKEIFM